MKKQRLFIISLDAFGASDLEFAKTLPNFKFLLERSALVENVETVFPSLTYMCHTSISTGMYPHKHGVINNTKLQPNRLKPDWYWYDKDIQSLTIFDIAHRAGYKTASFLWPVTGRSRSIDYNLAEIFPNRPWQNQLMVSLYSSTPTFAYQLNKKFGHLRKGIRQPELDEFITAGVVDTIHNRNPDLMAVHFVDLDYMRHHYGVHSQEAKQAIIRMDKHLGQILDAMREKGILNGTALAILGDHFQIDTHTVVRLNTLFKEKGWVKTDDKGAIIQWDVVAKDAGGACYIYTNDETKHQEIKELLEQYPEYIARIFTGEEANQLGADPTCAFLIDAKEGYYFDGEAALPFTEPTAGNPDLHRATHGFSPLRDHYDTMLMMSGPGIDSNAHIQHARLVDEGPTFLHTLGLTFPYETDGDVLHDLFL